MICKYCGKEISKGEVWNPDRYGNGYHYRCLIEMEFARATRVKRIPLDRIKEARDEIENLDGTTDDYTCGTEVVFRNMVDVKEVLSILDKLIAEVEKKE